jgi:CBS domain-containing protein
MDFHEEHPIMLLKDICTPAVICCRAEESALAAAQLMRQAHVGDLVVVADPDDDSEPLGIITDRDIVIEVLARERDPRTTRVRDVMRTPVVLARESEDLTTVLERMKAHGVRRAPVVGSGGRLIGIISLDDLLKQIATVTTALSEIVTREQSHEHRARR